MSDADDILRVPTLSDLFADTVTHNAEPMDAHDQDLDYLDVPDSTAILINERRREMRAVEARTQRLHEGAANNAGRSARTPMSDADDILDIPTINWQTGEIV